jgi:hypothetical protein
MDNKKDDIMDSIADPDEVETAYLESDQDVEDWILIMYNKLTFYW